MLVLVLALVVSILLLIGGYFGQDARGGRRGESEKSLRLESQSNRNTSYTGMMDTAKCGMWGVRDVARFSSF